MKTQQCTVTYWTFQSEVLPEVVTTHPGLKDVIAWADEHSVVWEVVTKRRSKAFGLGSCVYIGWAQRSQSPDTILERVRTFKELIEGSEQWRRVCETDESIFVWRARFTFEHYRDKGFTGGLFQQHDSNYPRSCLTLDYTSDTLEMVLDRFCAWVDRFYETKRITIDGKTVRMFETQK